MKIIKNIIQVLVCGIIVISVGININNQLGTLLEARRRNEELDKEIKKLSEENRIWEKKIEYATSSAFLEQEVRDKLGMGGRDDYWVETGTGSAYVLPLRDFRQGGQAGEAKPAFDENYGEAKPIWRQWLELFMLK